MTTKHNWSVIRMNLQYFARQVMHYKNQGRRLQEKPPKRRCVKAFIETHQVGAKRNGNKYCKQEEVNDEI